MVLLDASFFFVFLKSSGGWVKIKLKLSHFPRIKYLSCKYLSCVNLTGFDVLFFAMLSRDRVYFIRRRQACLAMVHAEGRRLGEV